MESLRATLAALDGRCRAPATGPGADASRGRVGGGGPQPPPGVPFPMQEVLGRPPRPRFNPYGAGGDAEFVDTSEPPQLNGLQVGDAAAPLHVPLGIVAYYLYPSPSSYQAMRIPCAASFSLPGCSAAIAYITSPLSPTPPSPRSRPPWPSASCRPCGPSHRYGGKMRGQGRVSLRVRRFFPIIEVRVRRRHLRPLQLGDSVCGRACGPSPRYHMAVAPYSR